MSNLPGLPPELEWRVTMNGDTVRVALHTKWIGPTFTHDTLLRFIEFDGTEYFPHEKDRFLHRVEYEAKNVLASHNRRAIRQSWIQEHFS